MTSGGTISRWLGKSSIQHLHKRGTSRCDADKLIRSAMILGMCKSIVRTVASAQIMECDGDV